MKNKKSIFGYRKDSPYKNLPFIDIQSNQITMQGVNIPILGTSLETGEQKVMLPNAMKNYNFKNTKTVREVPLYQQGGITSTMEHQILSNYLAGLNEAEQDQFIDSYENNTLENKHLILNGITEDVLMKKGGKVKKKWPQWLVVQNIKNGNFNKKKQNGGLILEPIIPETTKISQALPWVDYNFPTVLPLTTFNPMVDYNQLSDEMAKNFYKAKVNSKFTKLIDNSREKQSGGLVKNNATQISQSETPSIYGARIGYQKGGSIPVYPEMPRNMSTVEVEDKETMLTPKGQLTQFEGDTHAEGGIPVILDSGSKIFSEFLKVQPEIVKQITGKESKKKISFAKLSKRYPTENLRRVLEDRDADEFEKETARISLLKHQAILETLFTGQELMKNENSIQDKPKTFQNGAVVGAFPRPASDSDYLDLSNISDRFYKLTTGTIFDTETGEDVYRNPDTGLYRYSPEDSPPVGSTIPKPISDNNYIPITRDKFPALATETPLFPDNLNPDGSTTPLDIVMPDRSHPGNKVAFPVQKRNSGLVTAKKNSTSLLLPFAPNPKPFSNFDTLPLSSATNPVVSQSNNSGNNLNISSSVQPITTAPTTEAKQSWFSENKDKFGINSKLAGTILDIGMTLSDNLDINQPVLNDRRKTPIFNRFYEFDDKEAQKMFSTQVQQINNSNLPEQVKQAQIAEITSNAADYQGKVDFANAQRYEGKREADLSKLQTYMDANIETKVQDLDAYRQKKARVEYLRDKFKSEQKAKVFNSVRNYLDYTEELSVANQLSSDFTINPITGRLKVKAHPPTQLKDNLLQQYAKQQNNTTTLPNGATATQIGNLLIITDPTGKSEIKEIK